MKKTKGPKVLLFDVETAPIIAHVWKLFDNNVALNQIQKDWSIISWSAKWLGEKKIMYMDNRNSKDVNNDKKLLQGIWKLLDEADVVIGQNSISFDAKKLNARFILHGMKPPSSYKHLDTKRISSRVFAFTSNKLEYLTSKLCKKHKKLIGGRKYAGHTLWVECLKGNKAAWKELERYNKADVTSLEELYLILAPWDSSIDFSVFTDDLEHTCSCGSKKLEKKGYAYTATGKFQRYVCKSCGRQSKGKQNLLSKAKRDSLKVRI